jgi:hypothetical protein
MTFCYILGLPVGQIPRRCFVCVALIIQTLMKVDRQFFRGSFCNSFLLILVGIKEVIWVALSQSTVFTYE